MHTNDGKRLNKIYRSLVNQHENLKQAYIY